jgi:hypothetical protein
VVADYDLGLLSDLRANSIGRWVDFVECGPATFFSRAMYQKCVYDLLREDLASGWGYDVFWHKFCHTVYGFNRSAVYAVVIVNSLARRT